MFIKKLNQRGAAHLLFAVLLALTLVGVAGFVIYSKNEKKQANAAYYPPLNSAQCMRVGRVWNGSSCLKTCQTYAGYRIVSSPYDYCSKAASKISYSICMSKNRVWAAETCGKKYNAIGGAGGAPVGHFEWFCSPTSYYYHVASPYDYCAST